MILRFFLIFIIVMLLFMAATHNRITSVHDNEFVGRIIETGHNAYYIEKVTIIDIDEYAERPIYKLGCILLRKMNGNYYRPKIFGTSLNIYLRKTNGAYEILSVKYSSSIALDHIELDKNMKGTIYHQKDEDSPLIEYNVSII